MRAAVLALAAIFLACARLGGTRGDEDRREVRVTGEPLTADQSARLLAHARAGGLLWWRLPGAGGPRCEAWRLEPEPDDPERGRLVFVSPGALEHVSSDMFKNTAEPAPSDSSSDAPPAHDTPAAADPRSLSARPSAAPAPWAILAAPADGAPAAADAALPPVSSNMSHETSIMRLAYRLADGHLTLTAPEHERPVAAPPGGQKEVGRALTCVFTGVSVSGPAGGPGRLILAARERFFFTEEACRAAGFADDPPGADELRALGCAGALADPATRARLDRPPPADAADATRALQRARAVHHLRRGSDGALICDVWRNRPEEAGGNGRLEYRGRDERGAFVRTYAYDVGPGYLTLQGPAEYRRLRLDGRRTDVVQASSCLVTRGVTGVGAGAIDLGGERLYLSRRACDAARTAGAPAPAAATPQLVSACE